MGQALEISQDLSDTTYSPSLTTFCVICTIGIQLKGEDQGTIWLLTSSLLKFLTVSLDHINFLLSSEEQVVIGPEGGQRSQKNTLNTIAIVTKLVS